MEYLPKPLRKNSISVKPEKKKITMADLANLKNMMKRFERPGAATPEAALRKPGSVSRTSSSSSSISVNSAHSAANLDGLQASLDKQRTMRRGNSSRDLTNVLARSNDPLGSNSMHGSKGTMLGALKRNQMASNAFLQTSDHGTDPGNTLAKVDMLGKTSHGRVESTDSGCLYSSAALMGRLSVARNQSDNGSVETTGARSVHSLFSSSALILRRKKSSDDVSVMSSATTGSQRRATRRLSMGSKMPESPAPETTGESMLSHLRSNLANMGTGLPSTNLADLRAGLGLPSPYEKAKATTAVEQAVASSEHGTSSTPTPWGGALADLRRSVVSRRTLVSASAHDDDRPMTISRAVGRRSSIGGMALPPTTQTPQVKKRPSRSRSRGRSQSVQRGSKTTDESKSSEGKSPTNKTRDRSQSVQRIGKSTDKSPTKSSEKKGRKSSDVPPETKPSERKGRGRSRSVHRNSESKSSALPPETKAPDKKARGRSKSTQRRPSKTTKEQGRKMHDFNEFESAEAAKHEAEAAEAAEKEAAEKEAAGSALGRRRERSQSMSHRMVIKPATKYEPEDAITQAAESAVGRRRERSQSISHRRPPDAEIPPFAANSSIQTEKSKVDISTFGTNVDPGGFPAWDDSKDSSAPADFGAPVAWDDDPWAEDGGNFNPKAPTVTTKVETTPTVPAIVNFGESNDLFGSESKGLGSMLSHSRGGVSGLGSASTHSRGGGSTGSGSVSGGSGSGSMGRRRSLTHVPHMDSSFGDKASDAGSVSGRRNNLQGIRRSNLIVSATVPNNGQAVLAVPSTRRRASMTGSGFGDFDTSDVKSVGFGDHFDKADGEDCAVTSQAPPFAIAFAGKQVSTQKLDDATSSSGSQNRLEADSSQGPVASTGQRVSPPSAAALFAEKLEAAKKFDQAKGGSQHLPKADAEADSGQDADCDQVLLADSATEKLEAVNKLDEMKKMSQRLSGLDQAKGGSQRPLKVDSGLGIAEKFQAAKKQDEIRKLSQRLGRADSGPDLDSRKQKPSNAPQLTTASAFAAKLQAARQDDSMSVSHTVNKELTAAISSPTKTRKSSASSVSSPQKIARRQSMEMAYSPRPDNTAKKIDSVKSGLKHLRRSSLV
jgi:hypothetical protein